MLNDLPLMITIFVMLAWSVAGCTTALFEGLSATDWRYRTGYLFAATLLGLFSLFICYGITMDMNGAGVFIGK